MIRIFVLVFAFAVALGAQAECTLYEGAPTTLSIGAQTIHINADAPADTTNPIATYDTPTIGYKIAWKDCVTGTIYGKRPLNLGAQNTANKIYPTELPGVGIKLLFNNGSAFGNFPSNSVMQSSDPKVLFNLDSASFYRVSFFKISTNLNLVNSSGDLVLPAEDVGYHFMYAPDPANFMLKLAVGEIKIISTPTCTVDGAKTVDFNDVTPSFLKSGVARDLDFGINCKTDYGSYSATASITTETPSADADYIQVVDYDGNKDRMGIKISDSSGNALKVNGTQSEQKNNTSQGQTDYHWKATLIPTGKAPVSGKFMARAEIVFDIK